LSRGYARVKHEAMARGLMVYPTGGNVDGVAGDNVPLAPPFIVDAPTSMPSSSGSATPSRRRPPRQARSDLDGIRSNGHAGSSPRH
jgi:hypothetical protein